MTKENTEEKNMMVVMRESADYLAQNDFNYAMEKHKKFLDSGGFGGSWQMFATEAGIIFGVYQDAKGIEGEQAKFSHKNLEKVDLLNIELQYVDLVGVVCKNQNLKYSDLTGSLLIDSDFSGTSFEMANITDADLSRSNLTHCDFRYADLSNTDFEDADLTGSDLCGAIVEGTNFKGAVLEIIKRDSKEHISIEKESSPRFHLAIVQYYDRTLELTPEELEPLMGGSNYWHAEGSPSSWLAVDVVYKAISKYSDVCKNVILILAAKALGVTVIDLKGTINWHENYMRFHDGDYNYSVF